MTTGRQTLVGAEALPLQGVRVIEFGQFIAAPAAGQVLADLGADVIKIEPPGGDAARRVGWTADDCGPMFAAYNRGKRSIVLDLRQAQDLKAARALIASADVVLQNARPGAMERCGLGAADLRALKPQLVVGSVSGFGATGDGRARPGFDIAAQAESGMMSLNGEATGDPLRVGFAVVDVMAAHALTSGVMAALLRRFVSGVGGAVEVSLIDVATEAMAYPWAEYALTNKVPVRAGNGQPTLAPGADVVKTADGRIVVSAYMDEHFVRLCEAIQRPDLPVDPRFASNAARVAHRPALIEALSHALSAMTTAEASACLTKVGVVVGAVLGLDQVPARHDASAASLFDAVLTPLGAALRLPGQPWLLDGSRVGGGALPGLGQHTAEVLQALGSADLLSGAPLSQPLESASH